MRKGQKHTEETKKKQRERRLLNPTMYWLNKNHSPETKKKISNKLYGKYRGDNNPSWKGGKWRWVKNKALLRDDYTCQDCGLRDEYIMDVDHIIPKSVRKELLCDIDNLITRCPNCHRRKTLKEYKEKLYGK